jgi:hypothetical protein
MDGIWPGGGWRVKAAPNYLSQREREGPAGEAGGTVRGYGLSALS